MYQNAPNLRHKLYKPSITDRVTFALQARLYALTRRESWAPMSSRVDATAAPLSPMHCREVQPDIPTNGQAR